MQFNGVQSGILNPIVLNTLNSDETIILRVYTDFLSMRCKIPSTYIIQNIKILLSINSK